MHASLYATCWLKFCCIICTHQYVYLAASAVMQTVPYTLSLEAEDYTSMTRTQTVETPLIPTAHCWPVSRPLSQNKPHVQIWPTVYILLPRIVYCRHYARWSSCSVGVVGLHWITIDHIYTTTLLSAGVATTGGVVRPTFYFTLTPTMGIVRQRRFVLCNCSVESPSLSWALTSTIV